MFGLNGLQIHPAARIEIGHLLIVAGPSGSGKSTFMKSLAAGRLDAAITSALPAGAAGWPHTNGFRVRGRVRVLRGQNGEKLLPGLVLHYDIMRVVGTRIASYADDPMLVALSKANALTLVNVWAHTDVLVRQIGARRDVRSPLRHFFRRLEKSFLRRGPKSVYLDENQAGRHRSFGDRYRDPTFLAERWSAWERFVRRAAGARLVATLQVEGTGGGSFRRLV